MITHLTRQKTLVCCSTLLAGLAILVVSLLLFQQVATTEAVRALSTAASPAHSSGLTFTYTVTSRADSNEGTLRQAMLNALPGDTITFDPEVFPPTNPMTITLLGALPEITQGDLTIDASNAGVILDGRWTLPGTDGFHITSDGNVIKGLQIHRFPNDGVEITNGAKNNTIGGDWTVGSALHGEGNIITLNGDDGVDINGTGTMSNTVSGNYIGTNASGMSNLGNTGVGVGCGYDAEGNTIKYNVISGNGADGIAFNSCDRNTIVGNHIGTDASGVVALGNDGNGVYLDGTQRNVIGPGNVIAYNNWVGIGVGNFTTLYNTITQNSIHSNALRGIETWNGGNAELSPPALTDVNINSVSGIAPVAGAIVEIFSDDEDEGRVYEGSTTADDVGNFTFSKATCFSGPYLTATATDAEGNTSEFSNPVLVPRSTCTVTSTADSGAGTLRWCLSQAEPCTTIDFDTTVFSPASPATITVASELPHVITDSLTIDASGAGVILDGSQLTGSEDGLHIDGADYVTIRGLQIVGFPNDGVEITDGAKHNIIGGDWTVGSAPHGEGNVITLNGDDGVDINATGTMSNTVSGNLIGLDLDGTRDIRVQAVVIAPDYASDQTLYIGTKFHGVWKTTDGGSSWTDVNSGLTILDVRSLAISPNYATDKTLFAGTADGGIFRTLDGGGSWTRVDGGVISSDVVALAISPDYANDGHIFAAAQYSGVFASTDWGDAWTDRSSGVTGRLADLVISPNYSEDRTLFAASIWSGGIFKTENQGYTWTVSMITDTSTLAVSPNYANDQTLFAGSGDFMFRSTDEGSSWEPVGGDPGWDGISTLAISPGYETDQTSFAGDFWGGVFKSSDGGENWDRVRWGYYNQALSLSPAYTQDETLFVGRGTAGICKSIDGGDEWTDVSDGLMEHGNHGSGVHMWDGAQGNTIGGDTSGQRNVISHNEGNAIQIHDTGTANNIVIGNYIGTDVSGTTALGNAWIALNVGDGAQENVIGGPTAGERNVISGNVYHGVQIGGSRTMFNTVIGNYIGTDAAGAAALGNGGNGMYLCCGGQRNVIGPGNVIAYNKYDGVKVVHSTTLNNTITRNSIHSNDLQGIENWDGGNAELSPPTLTDANLNSVSGNAPVPNAIIEIFSDDEDEGRVYEGSTTADEGGNFTFTKPTGFSGPCLTATATDSDGNTSEFSSPVCIGPTPTPTATATHTPTPTSTPSATPTSTPTPTHTPTIPAPTLWTVMIYLNGDNDLDGWTFTLFNRLEQAVADNLSLIIRVLWDRMGDRNTVLYHVQPNTDAILAVYEEGKTMWSKDEEGEFIERDMGHPDTLLQFISQTREQLPAQHYLLAIVNHGGGWSPQLFDPQRDSERYVAGASGFSWDWTNDFHYLSTQDMGYVFSQSGLIDDPIDIVFYDACLMGMLEEVYEIRKGAGFFVASEYETWTSYPYAEYLTGIDDRTPEAQATWMVDTYYASLVSYPRSMTVIDLQHTSAITEDLDSLAVELMDIVDESTQKDKIYDAFLRAQKLDFDYDLVISDTEGYVDLGDFAAELIEEFSGTEVGNAAREVLEELDRVVAHERHRSGQAGRHGPHVDLGRATGLSIYLPLAAPEDGDLRFYVNGQLGLAQATHWDEFIFMFLDEPYPQPPPIDYVGGRGGKPRPGELEWVTYLPVVFKNW